MSTRRAVALALAVALVGGLIGCGRKAPNLPVEGGSYPRIYPAPVDAAPPATRSVPAPETPDQRRQRTAQPGA
ncbi:hypothetical protein [Roseospira visakhapatnamensis]|uniref:Lipoprotein n=1 Tax=Roseospira visakhapatnamensis TaxID=390880 RepID=A0A7W6RB64_9PROT|nr:hypothetical protein [Roseospira visakhapatnamensis]MBB4264704.1 hypothetical protein [Roseospira visakhapatnamensis]